MIIIVGAGGFAREVYQWVSVLSPYEEVKGFLSPNPKDLEGFDMPPILGDEDTYEIQEDDKFILGIGTIPLKKKVVAKLKERGAEFMSFVHPMATVSRNSKIGEGVVVCPYATVTESVTIGDFAMLNIYSSAGHDAKIGDNCILSPYATLNGFAVLENDVFMATHTVVTGSKRVGKGSIIGANSVVLHDVPENSKVIGVSKK